MKCTKCGAVHAAGITACDPTVLAAFEAALPLKRPSELTQRPLVQYLSAVSGGLLGEVSRLLNDAAEAAIRDGSERITLGHLEHVANRPS